MPIVAALRFCLFVFGCQYVSRHLSLLVRLASAGLCLLLRFLDDLLDDLLLLDQESASDSVLDATTTSRATV